MAFPSQLGSARQWTINIPPDFPAREARHCRGTLLGAAAWCCLVFLLPLIATSEDQFSPGVFRLFEQRALTHEGDAKLGRELFFNEGVTKCSVCHKVGGQGGDVGPD